jgi:hypothetical protein
MCVGVHLPTLTVSATVSTSYEIFVWIVTRTPFVWEQRARTLDHSITHLHDDLQESDFFYSGENFIPGSRIRLFIANIYVAEKERKSDLCGKSSAWSHTTKIQKCRQFWYTSGQNFAGIEMHRWIQTIYLPCVFLSALNRDFVYCATFNMESALIECTKGRITIFGQNFMVIWCEN